MTLLLYTHLAVYVLGLATIPLLKRYVVPPIEDYFIELTEKWKKRRRLK